MFKDQNSSSSSSLTDLNKFKESSDEDSNTDGTFATSNSKVSGSANGGENRIFGNLGTSIKVNLKSGVPVDFESSEPSGSRNVKEENVVIKEETKEFEENEAYSYLHSNLLLDDL